MLNYTVTSQKPKTITTLPKGDLIRATIYVFDHVVIKLFLSNAIPVPETFKILIIIAIFFTAIIIII